MVQYSPGFYLEYIIVMRGSPSMKSECISMHGYSPAIELENIRRKKIWQIPNSPIRLLRPHVIWEYGLSPDSKETLVSHYHRHG